MTSLVSLGAFWRSLQDQMLKKKLFLIQLLWRSSSLEAFIWQLARCPTTADPWWNKMLALNHQRLRMCFSGGSSDKGSKDLLAICSSFASSRPCGSLTLLKKCPCMSQLFATNLDHGDGDHHGYRKPVPEGPKLCIERQAINLAMLRHNSILGSQDSKPYTEKMNILHSLGTRALWNVAVSLLRKQSGKISTK